MIAVQNVTKRFGGFAALDGLNMNVAPGSVYALIGPNGAGKTTMLRHLAGIYKQDEGDIAVLGQQIFENTAVKEKIAYIPDDVPYFFNASTREMMRFYSGIYPQFDTVRYAKLRGMFSVNEKKPIRRLSKGMQKQSAFWLALCMRPEVLILDEPLDGLDPMMRRLIRGIIMEDVAEQGTTVVLSSHNLREMEDICDHVGIVSHGRMQLERSFAELEKNMTKVRFVPGEGGAIDLPDLDVLNHSSSGKIETLIIRGDREQITAQIAAANPAFYEMMPLSLEEVFIYELGGGLDEII